MTNDKTLAQLENEIDQLTPTLFKMNKRMNQLLKKYELEEEYEVCAVLQKYHQNLLQVLNAFNRFKKT